MNRSDGQTDGAAETQAERTMRDTGASTDRDTHRVEPILDASGTLRRNVLRRLSAARAEQTESAISDGSTRSTR